MELSSLRVTTCELRNDPSQLLNDWEALKTHCQNAETDMVLLPEMPFSPWLAASPNADKQAWKEACSKHDEWLERLPELEAGIVAGTRPVVLEDKALNEAFIWTGEKGYQAIHHKYYLPKEAYFWEASWYERGQKQFDVADVKGIKLGFLICTEMWFLEHARQYAKEGIQLLLCPRATGLTSASKWLAGGRTAATCSGAFCLSSNRGGSEPDGFAWGSHAWIIHPEEADVLAVSSNSEPFITQTINLADANKAKTSYPRYVLE